MSLEGGSPFASCGSVGGRGKGGLHEMKPIVTRTNGPASSEEESVGSKRRRQTPTQGLAGGGNPDSGSRSVTSEGSANQSAAAQAKNKKRFVWPDDLHRDFVAAIFDVGLKSASPKTILEMMTNTRELTADHIKSHLQKYRLHRERARDEFLGNFGRPNNNLSRETPVVEEGAVDSDLSRSLLPRSGGGLGVGMSLGAASSSTVPGAAGGGGAGGAGGAGGDGAEGDTFRAQMTLIRECLSMQAGFQNVLKQALLSQQQLQNQLQAHLRALGLESSVDENAGVPPGAPRPGRPQQSGAATAAAAAGVPPVPPIGAAMQGGLGPGRGGGVGPAVWGGKTDASGKHPHHRHPGAPPHQNQSGNAAQQPPQSSQAPPNNGHHPIVTPNMQRRSAEQQMQEEMREHMDMHRQLVQRKNAQVSQYDDGSLMAIAASMGNVGGSSHQHAQASSSQPVQQSHPPHHHQQQPQQQQQPPHPHPQLRGGAAPLASGSSAASLGGAIAHNVVHGHPDLVDMDLTVFQWNDDDDHLFNFLMDPA